MWNSARVTVGILSGNNQHFFQTVVARIRQEGYEAIAENFWLYFTSF